ncbi:UNKNOWN [Stylonychia lemnae]|uniref:Uncharacterized protein n=1 Tax=Stylonychia lemnae TaxID=5949 RepID=A0A078A3L9_STYLE|nr:UNKNOWN [Stylonychia lemnae]|eukprot:CDW75339.1 UNKNOWN [Stylonychia lemnae]
MQKLNQINTPQQKQTVKLESGKNLHIQIVKGKALNDSDVDDHGLDEFDDKLGSDHEKNFSQTPQSRTGNPSVRPSIQTMSLKYTSTQSKVPFLYNVSIQAQISSESQQQHSTFSNHNMSHGLAPKIFSGAGNRISPTRNQNASLHLDKKELDKRDQQMQPSQVTLTQTNDLSRRAQVSANGNKYDSNTALDKKIKLPTHNHLFVGRNDNYGKSVQNSPYINQSKKLHQTQHIVNQEKTVHPRVNGLLQSKSSYDVPQKNKSNSTAKKNGRLFNKTDMINDSTISGINGGGSENKVLKIVRARLERDQFLLQSPTYISNLDRSNKTISYNPTNETQRETSPELVHNSKSLKVYKDGKVISYGAGPSLLTQKGNRLMEDKTIHNINNHYYDVKKRLNVHVVNNSSQGAGRQASQSNNDLDPFVKRQIIDEQRRKQQQQQQIQLKAERDEQLIQEQILKKQQRQGGSLSDRVQAQTFDQFYQNQLQFKSKVESSIENKRREEAMKTDIMGKKACPKPCKGSERIIQKYKKKILETDNPRDESSSINRDNTEQVYDRLYNNQSLIPGIQNKKNFRPERYGVNSEIERKVSKDHQEKYMEKLMQAGNDREGSAIRKHSDWLIKSSQMDLATSKTHTDKIMFDKLRKDFTKICNLEIYYAALCYASKRQETNTNEMIASITEKLSKAQQQSITTTTTTTTTTTQSVAQVSIKNSKVVQTKPSNKSSTKSVVTSTFSKSVIIKEDYLRNSLLRGTPIRYSNYVAALHQLGYLSDPRKITTAEEIQLQEIWKILGGVKSKDRTIKAENLFIFLAALLNIRLAVMIQRHDEEKLPDKHRFEGYLCFDEFENAHFICPDDITKVYKKFKQLALNRLNRKRDESSKRVEVYQDKPQFAISDNSKAYLELLKKRSVSIASARVQIKKTLAYDIIEENPTLYPKQASYPNNQQRSSRNQSPSSNLNRVFSQQDLKDHSRSYGNPKIAGKDEYETPNKTPLFGNKARMQQNSKKIENSYEQIKKQSLLDSKNRNNSKYVQKKLSEAEIQELINQKFNNEKKGELNQNTSMDEDKAESVFSGASRLKRSPIKQYESIIGPEVQKRGQIQKVEPVQDDPQMMSSIMDDNSRLEFSQQDFINAHDLVGHNRVQSQLETNQENKLNNHNNYTYDQSQDPEGEHQANDEEMEEEYDMDIELNVIDVDTSELYDRESLQSHGSIHSNYKQFALQKVQHLKVYSFKFGEDEPQRLIIYEDDDPQKLALRFAQKCGQGDEVRATIEGIIENDIMGGDDQQ